jgi:hypothetical protein
MTTTKCGQQQQRFCINKTGTLQDISGRWWLEAYQLRPKATRDHLLSTRKGVCVVARVHVAGSERSFPSRADLTLTSGCKK